MVEMRKDSEFQRGDAGLQKTWVPQGTGSQLRGWLQKGLGRGGALDSPSLNRELMVIKTRKDFTALGPLLPSWKESL